MFWSMVLGGRLFDKSTSKMSISIVFKAAGIDLNFDPRKMPVSSVVSHMKMETYGISSNYKVHWSVE